MQHKNVLPSLAAIHHNVGSQWFSFLAKGTHCRLPQEYHSTRPCGVNEVRETSWAIPPACTEELISRPWVPEAWFPILFPSSHQPSWINTPHTQRQQREPLSRCRPAPVQFLNMSSRCLHWPAFVEFSVHVGLGHRRSSATASLEHFGDIEWNVLQSTPVFCPLSTFTH